MTTLLLSYWLAASAVGAAAPSNALKWFHTSAEMRAAYVQIYALAQERVAAVATTLPRGTWAVVVDADETLLDNSAYRVHLALTGEAPDWEAWAREQRSVPLPGAIEFVRGVHALGGRVVVVTNRSAAVCPATHSNLEAIGITVDAVLCAVNGVMDKNPRFRAVAAGTSAARLPPLRVVAYVGDNIRDFPDRSQAHPGSLADFGHSLFALPNPMYGSWEDNAVRQDAL